MKRNILKRKSKVRDNLAVVVLGNPFVYGKQNIFYQFKAGSASSG